MGPGYLDCAAFSGEECDAIVALAPRHAMEPATVWNGSAYDVNAAVRLASRTYLARSDRTGWIYTRLDTLFAAAAARFNTPVAPLLEDIQIVHYPVGGHFQAWHSDAGADKLDQRLISLSVELSEPGDHDGGVLEIASGTLGQTRSLPRGGARLFSSRLLHRVSPVTRGERYALVAWTGVA